MTCTISNALYWRPVVAPNPNIPFEFYLELIARPRFPSQCMQYPAQANLVLRPKPLMFYPCNAMVDAMHFKPNSITIPPSQSFIREHPKETCFIGTSAAAAETKSQKHGKSTNVKKYKCKQCGRCFSRSNTLVTHERIHTGEKPFECDQCHRKFRQHGNLTRHKVIHTNVKPFSCPVCKRAFNRKSNLKTHIKIHRSANGLSET